jgi:hypothetical protein
LGRERGKSVRAEIEVLEGEEIVFFEERFGNTL